MYYWPKENFACTRSSYEAIRTCTYFGDLTPNKKSIFLEPCSIMSVDSVNVFFSNENRFDWNLCGNLCFITKWTGNAWHSGPSCAERGHMPRIRSWNGIQCPCKHTKRRNLCKGKYLVFRVLQARWPHKRGFHWWMVPYWLVPSCIWKLIY